MMKKKIDTILCDLDGVLTQTASLHGRAWKLLFDGLPGSEAKNAGAVFREFDIATSTRWDDYREKPERTDRYKSKPALSRQL
ncbi:alpha,alpha-trehalase [Gillisia sp. Hel_I_86]|nr:alpha,alpha-trehalase [Gillisia sp. Hel_I_86]